MITPTPSPTASNGRDGNGKSPDRSGHHKRRAFLRAYAETCNIKLAAQAAGIHRQRHYDWMKDDDYAKAFDHAKQEAVETLEAEARRRAVDGWEVPVYQGGRKVGAIRKYSDLLLIFLLKAAAPETYRDNYHDHRHLHAHEHRHGLTPAEQQKVKRNDKIIAQLEAREKPEQHRPPSP